MGVVMGALINVKVAWSCTNSEMIVAMVDGMAPKAGRR